MEFPHQLFFQNYINKQGNLGIIPADHAETSKKEMVLVLFYV